MFAYYPLPADGGGTLTVTTDPWFIEHYEPANFAEINLPIEAFATGGTGPYTFSWVLDTGGPDIYLGSFTGKTNTVNAVNPDGVAGEKFGSATVTVTDAASNTASHIITITIGFGVNPV